MTEIAHAVLAANKLTEVAIRKQRLGIESGIKAALQGHAGCAAALAARSVRAERHIAVAVLLEYLGDSMDSRADHYRVRAAECARIATHTLDPSIKRQYEDLAQQWLDLAQQVDDLRRD